MRRSSWSTPSLDAAVRSVGAGPGSATGARARLERRARSVPGGRTSAAAGPERPGSAKAPRQRRDAGGAWGIRTPDPLLAKQCYRLWNRGFGPSRIPQNGRFVGRSGQFGTHGGTHREAVPTADLGGTHGRIGCYSRSERASRSVARLAPGARPPPERPALSKPQITPAVVVRVGPDGTPFYEAKWRQPVPDGPSRQLKRRLGRAWLELDKDESWQKRRGRTPEGWLDGRSAHVAAAEAVAAVTQEAKQADVAAVEEARAAAVTVRQVAHEWLGWLRDVRDASPSTVKDYTSLLREPGEPFRRGSGTTPGRIMAAFGDALADEVTSREVSAWLRGLDAEGLTARNVNKHRQVLRSIFVYGQRLDTHALPTNPVAATDKRRETPAARLDFYEAAEVEALARACEQGRHRGRRGRAHPDHTGPAKPAPLSRKQRAAQEAERTARTAEDSQDADLFRVLFYSGLRLGEVLALRWSDVAFLADLSGASLHVQRTVSAGVEKVPKSRRSRMVPLPRQAAEVLARVGSRAEFTSDDDYVFCNRFGRRLDGSALRSRYGRAVEAAGLRHVRLHGLRHAAGSVLARSIPLVSVRDVLGHSDLSTTNRYLHSKVDAAAVAAVNRAYAEPAADEATPSTAGA
jgi:integrase